MNVCREWYSCFHFIRLNVGQDTRDTFFSVIVINKDLHKFCYPVYTYTYILHSALKRYRKKHIMATSGRAEERGTTGSMHFLEGRIMLERHIALSQQTMEAVRVDLREFLLKNKEAKLPRGGDMLPGGGGIPKIGARLPGKRPESVD